MGQIYLKYIYMTNFFCMLHNISFSKEYFKVIDFEATAESKTFRKFRIW